MNLSDSDALVDLASTGCRNLIESFLLPVPAEQRVSIAIAIGANVLASIFLSAGIDPERAGQFLEGIPRTMAAVEAQVAAQGEPS